VVKAVTDLPKFNVDHEGVCKGCAQGKNIKNPFRKSDSKAERILELIHSDVCGPMPSTSLSGYEYYVSFIDDYSHKTQVYFLNSKDKVFGKFKEFKALIENLSVMFPSQDAKNITFFMNFYVFFGCGILSNTLQILVF
jgi:hypothetical protein